MSSNLINELQRIIDNQLSGIVFVASGDNRSAQISFLDGVMVFALCQGQKGRKALELIAQMGEVRFRFQKGAIPASRIEMPSVDEVFACFNDKKKANISVALPSEKVSAKGVTAAVPEGQSLSNEEKQLIREVLTECIGPMALILCEDYLDAVKTVEEAIEVIVNEIPAQQAARFREGVLGRL
jgi:hypothetical protein